MTSTQARHTRRAVLQSVVDAGARCASSDLEMWFRGDDEPDADWQTRRTAAQRVCIGCPVRAACEELALRSGDGEADVDELVRAGLTGPELAAVRVDQAVRLAVAVDRDRDTEGRLLEDLSVELQTQAGRSPDTDQRRHEQHLRLRALSASIRRIRTARRARTGWGTTGLRAGIADDMTQDDDARGPERDETDQYNRVVPLRRPVRSASAA
ncbi:WhiB family transcriptional regulator [Streptomyces sp. NBC_00654]|uniref:WhiB family transcriptional regulator n=1 Tax=Streptomyces sp. NBC_00654 TaxID=2975799 RepID=UPI002252FE32|nr:WhiB family transcriptional regulator [Streptomyces sp. NBC_00654]MCX4971253.1 WhiB family transcriptional regulator [Streptomyces sp. NBC_00654]